MFDIIDEVIALQNVRSTEATKIQAIKANKTIDESARTRDNMSATFSSNENMLTSTPGLFV